MFGRVFKSWSVVQPNQKPTPLPKNNNILPDQISGRILDLQIECEKETISKQVVFQLIAQYTKAVQFYEEQSNDKYKLYQKRMHNFLAKPLISSILKGQSGEMIIKKQRKQETIRNAENKAEKQARQILLKQQQKQKKHQIIVREQINKQQQMLEERIKRKRTNSNRSMQQKKTVKDLNNEQSGKKQKEIMHAKLLLNGISERSSKLKVFL